MLDLDRTRGDGQEGAGQKTARKKSMGTKRCKGGGELRLVPGTNKTRGKFGFLSHKF
jgi:hypothetical protein